MPDDAGDIRSTVLEAIKANIEQMQALAARVGGEGLAQAATDLYGKNTPGDSYSKNTQRTFDQNAIVLPAETISELLRNQ